MTTPQVKTAAFGSESGHWYDRDGNLIEKVLKADGKSYMRPTLMHARKLDLAPGCTTIIKQAHTPQLVKWMINQAVLAAKTLPDQAPDEDDKAYLQRVHDDANAHAREAAEEGTRIHKAIEQSMRAEPFDPAYVRHVEAVHDLLLEHCGEARWLPERGVVSRFGYATKADCVSEYAGWLVDFKGCDGDQDALGTKKTWESHHMQLAATRDCIAPELRCAIVYVSRSHPGACSFVEVPEDKLYDGIGMFKGLLSYWFRKTKYRPSWAEVI